ncbi:putative RNA polymerase sigma factor rfaY [Capnocytophaga canis]|uniref:RNA polymerase sigma factor n=2 Tax=Capnocytophaga canis TaxID=1848903 RepID=A0A0B7IET5_9FLAO|nr:MULTISPECIES: RNA polymerase sigma factor [Capnocytophaga]ATA74268.1 RNA polymerase sigma factor [Capnocytophaga sp. H2931]RIY37574.1 RNA polymerase sigma factor [Capnocytophaga canis]CEN42489.1 putative RNA polymerase sigma factor rfaY [Capnocytophaga canis]CEN48522.1 putative RNA polymerase sigma factor rfaY [Capnocytophaga canis]CEN54244.1 putative RNA polymerase sigma factor rfaY [Capnocytophaga canis]
MTHQTFLDGIRPFQDKIFRFAKRLLLSSDEAEDVSQDILMKLWQQRNTMETIKNWEAYAMTLTKNLCYDRLKAKSSDNISLSHITYQAENEISLQKQVEARDLLEQVKNIINGLSEQQRMIMQLRDIEQYEFEEIEKITGIKEATIRVILSRARKTIRESLRGELTTKIEQTRVY